MVDKELSELAAGYGIVPEYYDIWGQHHHVAEETLRALLAAMGVRVDNSEDLERELVKLHEAPWLEPCDPVLVIRHGTTLPVWSLRLPADESEDSALRIRWELRDECGQLCHKAEVGPGI